ncbi:MAG: YggS family pyridoxal phosphate-dependent enzyme [Acidobacteriia bacterium]|nr:YggS family pyridoxal phosphate-dependent enzyme [Terriglobia bacterium]
MLQENLARVEERIVQACRKAGRSRREIILVAVTKVFPASAIRDAYALGLREFGENYVQEFEGKHPEVADLEGARFHLIGHLQSNKSRRAAELFSVIQTVDSAKLARKLDETGAPLEIMLEVKLSEEESKYGAAPETVAALAAAVRQCSHLRLSGLMTMPPWCEDAEQSRPYFRRLRQLAEAVQLPGESMALSMGMSHDFEAAIEEGATHIRVGTALFGKRKLPQGEAP